MEKEDEMDAGIMKETIHINIAHKINGHGSLLAFKFSNSTTLAKRWLCPPLMVC